MAGDFRAVRPRITAADQEIGLRTIRPYAMNAMRRPSTPLRINGRGRAVLDVHPDEHEALDRQDRGGYPCERRPPVEGGGDDQPGCIDELEDAKDHSGSARQRTKEGTSALALSNTNRWSNKAIRFHLAEQSAELVSQGMTDEQAEAEARRSFGDTGHSMLGRKRHASVALALNHVEHWTQ